jgi:filamentous hemagglutinin family protein
MNQTALAASAMLLGVILLPAKVIAQISPDNSLGGESSRLNTDNPQRLLIEGGAQRGRNLFHSFSEFQINLGEKVYFQSPAAIENIIGRVTGKTASRIDGTLGVLGNANLFLINPQGITFGRNARLDISGSFFAGTSEQLLFNDGTLFSTDLEQPTLLTISTPLGLSQWLPTGGTVSNSGNLSVGRDLTLVGHNLELQGNLAAGGNLSLLATAGLIAKEDSQNPFAAMAVGNLLLQGNETLAIVALNHPQSGLFAGKNLLLRSQSPIVGDTHVRSGGNFSLERLNGELGDLRSSQASLFTVAGDFSVHSFTGASLQILTGGKVFIPGTITINAPGEAFNDSTVTLSNGHVLTLRGTSQPTLDLRAGTLGFPGNPQGASITIGNIVNPTGLVFLSNQFQANPSLKGDISVKAINTSNDNRNLEAGGAVVLDSRGQISIFSILANGRIEATAPFRASSKGGDITLLAQESIIQRFQVASNPTPANRSSIISQGRTSGTIHLESQTEIRQESGPTFGIPGNLLSAIRVVSQTGTGGDITLTAPKIFLNGAITSAVWESAQGSHLNFLASESFQAAEATLSTQTIGVNKSGNIILNSPAVTLDFTFLGTSTFSSGDAGAIDINTNTLTAIRGGQIVSSTRNNARGNAGNVTVKAQDSITLTGFQPPELPGVSAFFPSSIASSSLLGSRGDSGQVRIETGTLSLNAGAVVSTGSFGGGNAGPVQITAREALLIDGAVFVNFDNQVEFRDTRPSGIFSELFPEARGGGSISIVTPILQITRGGTITATTDGRGNGGNIDIMATQSTTLDGLTTFEQAGFTRPSIIGVIADPNAEGNAGTISLTTPNLSLSNGARLSAQTRGNGAGDRACRR